MGNRSGMDNMSRTNDMNSMSRIMLLEDDLSLVNGLSFAFQKQGYALEIARTVADAEKLWRKGSFDLLVLDVSLPDGSGFEFCQEVQKTSSVPIIFLTASDEETSIIMGLDIGGDDYITKPFKLGGVGLAHQRPAAAGEGLRHPADVANRALQQWHPSAAFNWASL